MHQRRDIIILIVLFIALVVFTILGPGQSRDDSFSSKPTTHSSTPGGTLALLRWTRDLGYESHRLEYTEFGLEDRDDALVIINPTESFNRTQTDYVLDWVAQGGTLILVESRSSLFAGSKILLHDLNLTINAADDTIVEAEVLQPVLSSPPIQTITAQTNYVINPERDDVAYLAGIRMQDTEQENEQERLFPVLIGLTHGRGYIYVSSALFPFTNDGLRIPENGALVLNMLRRVPSGGRILFDEWHHGFHTPPSVRSVLLSHPWGQALIYALVVVALYMALTGRRFGKPIPLREEVAFRSSAEYVESMADLFQRGRKRDFIVQHYYTSFKRRLAKPYGINPKLDDAAFVAELARYADDVDEQKLLALLHRLRRTGVSEDELARSVADMIASESITAPSQHSTRH